MGGAGETGSRYLVPVWRYLSETHWPGPGSTQWQRQRGWSCAVDSLVDGLEDAALYLATSHSQLGGYPPCSGSRRTSLKQANEGRAMKAGPQNLQATMPEESFGLFSSSIVQRFTRTNRSAEAQRHQIHLRYRLLSFVPRPSSVLRSPSSPSDASCTATGPWRIGGIRGASMEWSPLVGCCLAACVRWTPCRDDGDGGWLMLKVMRRKSLGAGCAVTRPFREMSPKIIS